MPTQCSGYTAKIHGFAGWAPVDFWVKNYNGSAQLTWTNFQTEVPLFGAPLTAPVVNYIGFGFTTAPRQVGVAQIVIYDNLGAVWQSSSLVWTAGATWKKWKFSSSYGISCVAPLVEIDSGTGSLPPGGPP